MAFSPFVISPLVDTINGGGNDRTEPIEVLPRLRDRHAHRHQRAPWRDQKRCALPQANGMAMSC